MSGDGPTYRTRDKVWDVALVLAGMKAATFTVNDIEERTSVSTRTIQEVLAVMVDMRWLASEWDDEGRKQYRPGPRMENVDPDVIGAG